jgi:uncharacterized small protein (DUF1192 family)
MDDEAIRIPRETEWTPRQLDDMSVDGLRAYAEQLETELERVQAAIGAKQDYLTKADTLFRS